MSGYTWSRMHIFTVRWTTCYAPSSTVQGPLNKNDSIGRHFKASGTLKLLKRTLKNKKVKIIGLFVPLIVRLPSRRKQNVQPQVNRGPHFSLDQNFSGPKFG